MEMLKAEVSAGRIDTVPVLSPDAGLDSAVEQRLDDGQCCGDRCQPGRDDLDQASSNIGHIDAHTRLGAHFLEQCFAAAVVQSCRTAVQAFDDLPPDHAVGFPLQACGLRGQGHAVQDDGHL